MRAVIAFVMVCAAPLAALAQGPDTIAEIRVHGNHTTPDAEVLALTGLAVGSAAGEERLRAAERTLRDTGRFANAEVRRRYLSIADPSQVLVIVVVDEHAAVTEADPTPGPLARMRASGMWFPILNYADGYGFTYGARVTFVGALGRHTRLSAPLSWGGERRAAMELTRSFDDGQQGSIGSRARTRPVLLTSVGGSLAAYRRVNPHFDVPDNRLEARVRAERAFGTSIRAGAVARTARVTFGDDTDRHDAVGADVAVDTSIDPSFPRNAVQATLGWERLRFNAGHAGRLKTDVRGYVGVGGSAVLALRSRFALSDAPLPASEQSLLGGDSLRGYRTGHRAGDNLAALSAELRLPVNSPLSAGRLGVKAFVDTGTIWASGTRLADQRFERGIGGGIYFGATAVMADLDVAWPESGKPRVVFGLGVNF